MVKIEIYQGDVRQSLATLPDKSIHCVITSPPYWGLRDYGLEPLVWGGEEGCAHEWEAGGGGLLHENRNFKTGTQGEVSGSGPLVRVKEERKGGDSFCRRCSAWRGSLGLEPTIDLYVEHMVEIFREVRRVLRPDGTLFLNLGDSYNTSGGQGRNRYFDGREDEFGPGNRPANDPRKTANGLKQKDLCGIPWKVALALQEPYHNGPIKREADRAWLAAFIDGEGTIGIKKDKGRSNGGSGKCQPGYSIFLSAGNQDRELLDRCVSITGYGTVGIKDRPSEDKRGIKSRHDYFGWWISSNQAVAVLRDIYPFLVAKRRQAIIAYTLDVSNKNGRSLRGNGPLPASEQDKRGLLKELCNRCNQREQVDLPAWVVEPPSNYEPGWWLRSDIIWSKPNPMPESCTDRPTKSHEYIFLLTKSAHYFWDQEAVKVKSADWPINKAGRSPGEINRNYPGNPQMRNSAFDRQSTNGRNLRTVWDLATEPFPEAHFATFPQRLVQRCLQAGTSERGCCPECGAPWRRVVEKNKSFESGSGKSGKPILGKNGPNCQGGGDTGDIRKGPCISSSTLGWTPTCTCYGRLEEWREYITPKPGKKLTPEQEAENKLICALRQELMDYWTPMPVKPCTILDPFGGSGTAALVAGKMGLNAVICELKPEYVEMARQRLAKELGMLANISVKGYEK